MAVANLERTMTFKVTEEQHRAIKRAARQRGMRVSQWVRSVLTTAAAHVTERNGAMRLEAPRLP